LQQLEVQADLQADAIPHPWFPAYKKVKTDNQNIAWYSALVPVALVPRLLKKEGGWDFMLGDGHPSVWTHHDGRRVRKRVYCPYGNEEGIEPLVLYRSFHGLRESFLELAQEFRLFHNLYPDHKNRRFIYIDDNGDESGAARYGEGFLEVRTDLLQRFCATKRVALAVYVDSLRYSPHKISDLGLREIREKRVGERFQYHLAVVPYERILSQKDYQAMSRVLGKKFILPGPVPADNDHRTEVYQEFVIGTDAAGKPIRHTCDPDKLADYFGKNPKAPHYLTPVFFRAEVLSKYYADPRKYSVEDGYLRCGGLWGLQIDNDHPDYVVVYLGDLGRDLSENERNYWLSFNIPPQGRGISPTAFRRGSLAEFAEPARPDLVFKLEYTHFCKDFQEEHGWELFRSLHADDEHFLTALRLPPGDNQAEFDTQLLALTKVLVDSLNEAEIAKGLTTLSAGDKGITKLEKFFVENGLTDYERHIRFLRILQDLRSTSAAHRKGSSYDELVEKLQLADEGRHRVFAALLVAAVELLRFLRERLLAKKTS